MKIFDSKVVYTAVAGGLMLVALLAFIAVGYLTSGSLFGQYILRNWLFGVMGPAMILGSRRVSNVVFFAVQSISLLLMLAAHPANTDSGDLNKAFLFFTLLLGLVWFIAWETNVAVPLGRRSAAGGGAVLWEYSRRGSLGNRVIRQ
jgi:hypothetical protein